MADPLDLALKNLGFELFMLARDINGLKKPSAIVHENFVYAKGHLNGICFALQKKSPLQNETGAGLNSAEMQEMTKTIYVEVGKMAENRSTD